MSRLWRFVVLLLATPVAACQQDTSPMQMLVHAGTSADTSKAPADTSKAPAARTAIRRGLVSFVIDDGCSCDYTYKKPIFDAHGAIGVLAVPSRNRGLTDSQLRTFQRQGWEIASHGRYHLDETTLTEPQLDSEIGGSKADLEALGLRVRVHVYPYTTHDSLVDAVTAKYFEAGFLGEGGLNSLPLHYMYGIYRLNLGSHHLLAGQEDTFSYYASLVDTAKSSRAWLIFVIHEVDSTDAKILGDVLDYVHTEAVPIVSLSAGLDSIALAFGRGRRTTK